MALNGAQKLNNTSQIIEVEFFDTATGKLKTGLTSATANLVIYTSLNGAAHASIGTLTTMTEGTWTSLGFVESTGVPGRYQIGVPNTKLNSSVGALRVSGRVTTDNTIYMRPELIEILGVDAYSALPVDSNMTQVAGQTATAATGVTFPSSIASPTNISAGTIATVTNVTTVNGLAAGVITAASIAANAITAAKVATDTITAIRDGLLNWVVFTGYTLARVLRIVGIVFRGTKTGSATSSEVFTAPADGSTITVTADSSGNRSAMADTASGTP